MDTRYSSVVESLRRARAPVYELGTTGKVAVTLAAGRIVAMAFSAHDPNLFWSNPALEVAATGSSDSWQALPGGLGGDRLWFSPELAFHWDGEPDWSTLANYKPPIATDPGAYGVVSVDSRSIVLRASGELAVHRSERRVAFEVSRTVQLTESPVSPDDELMSGVHYIGIETSHELKLGPQVRVGILALWHLLQVPIGAVLIVPTRKDAPPALAEPLSYALAGDWVRQPDHIMWRYGGKARAKFGLSVGATTGRAAVFRQLERRRWCMLVREFPCATDARYCDHPHGIPRNDQVLQAWDGDGFGELEFHSPALDAELADRELQQSDRLWAYGGSQRSIAALGERLLGVEVAEVFR